MLLRPATPADAAAINEIYNHYVLNSTCTYQEQPDTLEDRLRWLEEHGGTHPVIVAENEAGAIVGWASLSRFHPRSAFRFTVENSVYISPQWQRRGLGRLLMTELVRLGREKGFRQIIAAIDSGQDGSLALHAAFGFTEVARLRRVGFKFGRWLDVVDLQLSLEPV